MRNPVKITMKSEQLNLECIQQFYVALASDHEKYDALKRLFEFLSVSQCIIYVNSVKRVIDLHNAMNEEGFSVCCIHSSMSKQERDAAFVNFKTGGSRVLISSNITARGIDIQQVSIVINFDIPKCVHTYLHRIGRSGRWGRKGMAINFITRRDIQYMKEIENHYKSNIVELPINSDIQSIFNK
jgi:translation initiation factor 4A